jgi:competence protein ComEA
MARSVESGGARWRIPRGAVVVLAIVALAIAVVVSAINRQDTSTTIAPVVTSAPRGELYVHVLGAVTVPGLYQLREGDRVVDAIAAAGGFADAADETQLNLARVLGDGEQLYVPVIGEVPAIAAGGAIAGKVNLNTADAAALDTLPRVGPAMAQRIIDWREANGRFTTTEDLMSVTGIGEKTFDGLKDLVTV